MVDVEGYLAPPIRHPAKLDASGVLSSQYGGRRHIPCSRPRIHRPPSNVELVMKTGCHVGIGQAWCLLSVLMLGLAGFPGGAPAMPVGEPGCVSAEDCDDRDPCTRDDCNPDGTCTVV